VFGLGIPLDKNGPQKASFEGPLRRNPIHTMLATGTDSVAGIYDEKPKVRYADDALNMPVQAGAHWDALGHVFYGDLMYNGYPAKLVDSQGDHTNGLEHARDKMVGRGVLLDVARAKGVDSLENGYVISNGDLDATAEKQSVEI
jgi:putative cyclase